MSEKSSVARHNLQAGLRPSNFQRSAWLVPLLIFLVALLLRVANLGGFLTVDEPYWVARSRPFIASLVIDDYSCPPVREGRDFETTGLGCTFQAAYPGVTTTWLGGLGLLGHYWGAVRSTGVDLSTFFGTMETRPLDPTLIAPVRLPMALANSLFILVFYWLVGRLFSMKVAFLATLMVALNPFHIALSRVLHHDALTTTTMVLSLLSLIGYWLHGWGRRWLVFSAMMAGLALLTKPIGWFILPMAGLVGLLSLFYRWRDDHQGQGWPAVSRVAREGLLWTAATGLTFVAFFPAMWVIPLNALTGIVQITLEFANEGHVKGQFFLGEVARNPGWLFYPLGWLLRATPFEVLGLGLLGLAVVGRGLRRPWLAGLRQWLVDHPGQVALLFFLLTFFVFENMSDKKFVRYFLPAFPVLAIFAALGWLRLVAWLNRSRFGATWPFGLLAVALVLTQSRSIWRHYPYYFTYYNPLLGGSAQAARLMTTYGWGESLSEVGRQLNQLPQAESLRVVAWYNQALMPFFEGKAHDFSSQVGNVMDSEYLVFHRNQLQRNLHPPHVWRYFDRYYPPVYRFSWGGLDYVWVYKNPIGQHVDWEENSLPEQVTIFGYNLEADGGLTLFWQNVGLEPGQELIAGLAPVAGGQSHWASCSLKPAFVANREEPGALLESLCPFSSAALPSGVYHLRLGLAGSGGTPPVDEKRFDFPAGRLAVAVDGTGRLTAVDQNRALSLLAEQGRPADAMPLELLVGDIAWLVGYHTGSQLWQPGQTGLLTLYWQPTEKLDLALTDAFQLELYLGPEDGSESVQSVVHPLVPPSASISELRYGMVVPLSYPVVVSASLPPGDYLLDVCLTVAANSQPVFAVSADGTEALECLSLPVTIAAPQKG